MELTSNLDILHGKIKESEETGKVAEFRKLLTGLMSEKVGLEKLKIVEELRRETMQKCALKCKSIRPRVNLRKLRSSSQVLKEIRKINQNPGSSFNYSNSNFESNCEQVPEFKTEAFEFKMEFPFLNEPEPAEEEPDRNTFSDGFGNESGEFQEEFILPTIAGNMISEPQSQSNNQLFDQVRPTTGKYKCDHCPMEFSSESSAQLHQDSVHLNNGKYKCKSCGNEFAHLTGLKAHYEIIHLGVRHKCDKCEKTFRHRGSLSKHNSDVHVGRRFYCEFCPMISFTRPGARERHLRESCPSRQAPPSELRNT